MASFGKAFKIGTPVYVTATNVLSVSYVVPANSFVILMGVASNASGATRTISADIDAVFSAYNQVAGAIQTSTGISTLTGQTCTPFDQLYVGAGRTVFLRTDVANVNLRLTIQGVLYTNS